MCSPESLEIKIVQDVQVRLYSGMIDTTLSVHKGWSGTARPFDLKWITFPSDFLLKDYAWDKTKSGVFFSWDIALLKEHTFREMLLVHTRFYSTEQTYTGVQYLFVEWINVEKIKWCQCRITRWMCLGVYLSHTLLLIKMALGHQARQRIKVEDYFGFNLKVIKQQNIHSGVIPWRELNSCFLLPIYFAHCQSTFQSLNDDN